MKTTPHNIDDYPYHLKIQTRWNDNDVYGHINNTVYYTWFDTCVNNFLIENGLLKIGKSKTIGLVVDTACQYFAPLSYPEVVSIGLRVGKVGNSSVRYELAVFGENETTASAQGHFVHVYVDRKTRTPQTISASMQGLLSGISRAKAN